MLESMYEENYQYYLELEKYAVAGQMKADEIKSNQLPLIGNTSYKKGIRLLLCRPIPYEMLLSYWSKEYTILKWLKWFPCKQLLKSDFYNGEYEAYW